MLLLIYLIQFSMLIFYRYPTISTQIFFKNKHLGSIQNKMENVNIPNRNKIINSLSLSLRHSMPSKQFHILGVFDSCKGTSG